MLSLLLQNSSLSSHFTMTTVSYNVPIMVIQRDWTSLFSRLLAQTGLYRIGFAICTPRRQRNFRQRNWQAVCIETIALCACNSVFNLEVCLWNWRVYCIVIKFVWSMAWSQMNHLPSCLFIHVFMARCKFKLYIYIYIYIFVSKVR